MGRTTADPTTASEGACTTALLGYAVDCVLSDCLSRLHSTSSEPRDAGVENIADRLGDGAAGNACPEDDGGEVLDVPGQQT